MNYFEGNQIFRRVSVFQNGEHPFNLLIQTGNAGQFAAAMFQKSLPKLDFDFIESFQTIGYKGRRDNGEMFDALFSQRDDGFMCGRCQPGTVSQPGLVADTEFFRRQSQFLGGGAGHSETLRAVAVRQVFA